MKKLKKEKVTSSKLQAASLTPGLGFSRMVL